jgi:ElaB/YqjD/DUF883 family membrane-anchored ribosome-binding protein
LGRPGKLEEKNMREGTDRDTYQNEQNTTASRMKQQISGTVDDAKEKAADLGRKAVNRVDAQREPAAGALDRTADALHEQGDRWANTAAGAAHATADKIQNVADYVRSHDAKAMADDAGELVRRYPAQSLVAAAAVGFLVGRAFRSND